MRRKNYTEFDTEFVILDKRGKNYTRFGLGAPLSGGRPCCGGRFGGHFGRPPEMGGIWRLWIRFTLLVLWWYLDGTLPVP